MNKKVKVGFFSLASCEGCYVDILNLDDKLLDVLKYVEIVESRIFGIPKRSEELDVAFIEGAITCEEEIERAKEIRKRSKIVVALGDCACSGGKFMFKNFGFTGAKINQPPGKENFITEPIDKYIKVDYYLPGCPAKREEFVELVYSLLANRKFAEKPHSVCSECILYENDCLLEKGIPCLGPITQGGCGALCPTNGRGCFGCRGLYEDANIDGLIEAFKKHNIPIPDYLYELQKKLVEAAKHE